MLCWLGMVAWYDIMLDHCSPDKILTFSGVHGAGTHQVEGARPLLGSNSTPPPPKPGLQMIGRQQGVAFVQHQRAQALEQGLEAQRGLREAPGSHVLDGSGIWFVKLLG